MEKSLFAEALVKSVTEETKKISHRVKRRQLAKQMEKRV
jgi:hypothetical protein